MDKINQFQSSDESKQDVSSSNTNSSDSSRTENNSSPSIDMATILKMKSIMDKMNSTKDDPRSNLLLSLKPYLKESRKDKVDQYIKFFNMSKIFEILNITGGDSKK